MKKQLKFILAFLLLLSISATNCFAQATGAPAPLGSSATAIYNNTAANYIELYARANIRSVTIANPVSVNAIVATSANVPVTALVNGLELPFIAGATNTGAVTIALDSTAPTALVDSSGNALPAGAITSGTQYKARYVSASTQWRLLSATAVTIGTTTIGSGTSNGFLYDNAGVLGNLATANNGVAVTSAGGAPSISTTLPTGLAMQTPASINLTNATAPTAAVGTNTTQPASTAFVQNQIANLGTPVFVSGVTTLTASQLGRLNEYTASASYIVTLPTPSAVSAAPTTIWNNSLFTLTLSTPSGSFFGANTPVSTSTTKIAPNSSIKILSDTFNWLVSDAQIITIPPPCASLTGGCASAYSVTRAMVSSYTGNLIQVTRSSDSTTLNIGVDGNGKFDIQAYSTFCSNTTCGVDIVYDQVGSNNLVQATFASMPTLMFKTDSGIPYLNFTEAQNMQQTTTAGLPTGSASKTIGMVSNLTWSDCCAGFGMTENPAAVDGGVAEPGQMFSVTYLGFGQNGLTNFAFGADVEQGYNSASITPFQGTAYGAIKYNSGANQVSGVMNGVSIFAGQAPAKTINTGSRISLGNAGDSTPVPMSFYEGYITSHTTTAAEDAAVYWGQSQFYKGGTNQVSTQLNAICRTYICGEVSTSRPDTAFALNNTSTGGHAWFTQVSGNGTGALGGSGGYTIHDLTAGADRLGITSTGKLLYPGLIQAYGGFYTGATAISSAATLTTASFGNFIEATGGPYTAILPTPVGNGGADFSIWMNTSSTITFSTPAGGFYGPSATGASTVALSAGNNVYVRMHSDGFNWYVAAIPAMSNTGIITANGIIMGGSHPTGTTGTCVASSFVGGSLAGKFSAAVCAAGTFILSGLPAATNGYVCNAQDQTTPADTLKQTANTTTSVTFTSTTVAADAVVYSCVAY